MSAFGGRADIARTSGNVRLRPNADVGGLFDERLYLYDATSEYGRGDAAA